MDGWMRRRHESRKMDCLLLILLGTNLSFRDARWDLRRFWMSFGRERLMVMNLTSCDVRSIYFGGPMGALFSAGWLPLACCGVHQKSLSHSDGYYFYWGRGAWRVCDLEYPLSRRILLQECCPDLVAPPGIRRQGINYLYYAKDTTITYLLSRSCVFHSNGITIMWEE